MSKQTYPPSLPIETYLKEQMQDPKFRRAFEALEPEFQLVRRLLDLRLKRKLSRKEFMWMANELQEFVDLRRYDQAKASGEIPIRFEQAIAEIEQRG